MQLIIKSNGANAVLQKTSKRTAAMVRMVVLIS
jgi:hypothetical protein